MKFPSEINPQQLSLSSVHSKDTSQSQRSDFDHRTFDNSVNPYRLKMKKSNYIFSCEDIHKMETSFQPSGIHSHDSHGNLCDFDSKSVLDLAYSPIRPSSPSTTSVSTPLPMMATRLDVRLPPLRCSINKRDPYACFPGVCSEILLPSLP
jgi:hypothetical protein